MSRAFSGVLESYRAGARGLDRRVVVLAAGTFLAVAARMSLVTFLAIFLTEERHLALPLVGVAFLVENLARGVAAPFAGAWSDRAGRRVVLLTGLILTALILPLFLLVRAPWSLFLWSGALGLAQGTFFPASSALLLDLVPPERRQSALALNYTALSLGYTVGVAPAGFLVGLGYGVLALFSAGGMVLVALLLGLGLRRLPPPAPRAPGASFLREAATALRDRPFLGFAGLAFVFPMGIGLVAVVAPLYAVETGTPEPVVGLILASTGLILALLALPVNARVEASGPFRFLALSALAAGIGHLAIGATPGASTLFLGVALFTLGEVIFSAAIPTAVGILAPPSLRGAYQGAWGLVFSASYGAALFASGILRDALGWRATWIAFAVLTAAAGAGMLLARPWLRRVAETRAQA